MLGAVVQLPLVHIAMIIPMVVELAVPDWRSSRFIKKVHTLPRQMRDVDGDTNASRYKDSLEPFPECLVGHGGGRALRTWKKLQKEEIGGIYKPIQQVSINKEGEIQVN